MDESQTFDGEHACCSVFRSQIQCGTHETHNVINRCYLNIVIMVFVLFCIILFFFLVVPSGMQGFQFPDQGLNSCPLQWKQGVLTSRPPVKVLVAQSCPTLCNPISYSLPGSSVHGILQARIQGWVAIPFLQGIFSTQGSNLGLLLCKQNLYHLSHQGSPES